MKKAKEILKELSKKKKAVFILACCIVLLCVAVVQSNMTGSSIQGAGESNVDNSSDDTQADTKPEDDVTIEEKPDTELAVGVEPVGNTDEYFAKLRIENSNMTEEQVLTCKEIETSIITRGYQDACVFVNSNNELEITILCMSLTEDEVAIIASNAVSLSGVEYDNMTIKGICGI